jgi:methyl-accepting chemotaxis protein
VTAARRRRRLGYGLTAFGASGLVLVVIAAVLVLATLATVGDAATGFERQRAELLAMVEPAASALTDASDSASRAGASLTKASDASRRAADLMGRMATSFEAMAGLGSLDILGARPFAGVTGQFSDVAVQSRALAGDLGSTADALTTNVADSQSVAGDLRSLADRLRQLESSVQSTGGPGGSVTLPIALAQVVLLALLAWFAIPAVASIWLGRRLVNRGK